MKQPGIVTYNLKDRGRQFTGQNRDFNIRALMDNINGQACQEKIKSRGMFGYFGHKPRVLAGLEPVESMVINGKYNEIEPAIVTTYLEAFPDGTIKHQTEFLETSSGKKAARMFASRVGGFSSAIDQAKNELYGFDWVLSPNYHFNRPYALDSVDDSGQQADLTFDQVLDAVKSEEDAFWTALIEAKDAQIAKISAALDSVVIENEQYLSMLASNNTSMVLDSTGIAPLTVSLDSVNRMRNDTDFFNQTAKLPGFITPESGDQAKANEDYESLISRMHR